MSFAERFKTPITFEPLVASRRMKTVIDRVVLQSSSSGSSSSSSSLSSSSSSLLSSLSSSSLSSSSSSSSSFTPQSCLDVWKTDLDQLEQYLQELRKCKTSCDQFEEKMLQDNTAIPPFNSQTLPIALQQITEFLTQIERLANPWIKQLETLDKKLIHTRNLCHGRMYIYLARHTDILRTWYGDTDSTFIVIPWMFYHPTRYNALLTRWYYFYSVWITGLGLQDLVNPLFPYPMSMELEKWFTPLLIYCPKMYRYCNRTKYGAITKTKDSGLQTARRDISDFNKSVLLKVLDEMTNFHPERALQCFYDQALRMEHPEALPYTEFIRTVKRNRHYKLQNCYQVHLWRTLEQKYEQNIPVGSRIKFLILRPPTNQPSLDWKRRLIDEDHYIRENDEAKKHNRLPPHQVDMLYHFDLLVKGCVKLLSLFYNEDEILKKLDPIRTNLVRYQLHNHDIRSFFLRS